MMRLWRLLLGAAVLATAAPLAHAQAPQGDVQAWTALFVSGPVTDGSRLLVWFDGHARFRDDASDLGVSILRPAVGWRVGKGVDVWGGYARVVSRSEDAPDVPEDRLWQQATFSAGRVFGGAVSGRTRLEQRLRADSDTGWRLRQFVRWERRFDGRSLSPVVWNEVFVGLNASTWGQPRGFDQNRLFLGAAWRATPKVRVEAGYLNVHLETPTRRGRTDHNVSLSLFVGL